MEVSASGRAGRAQARAGGPAGGDMPREARTTRQAPSPPGGDGDRSPGISTSPRGPPSSRQVTPELGVITAVGPTGPGQDRTDLGHRGPALPLSEGVCVQSPSKDAGRVRSGPTLCSVASS
uniref:Uncharacterized protein n=1 Tax=Rousettus aegyptiacus TaxID=9407 RepID=A0A7J8DIF8_ROUAE|nr:hypothetical protein HJG63_008697 [Rousettus aegyptiacus]